MRWRRRRVWRRGVSEGHRTAAVRAPRGEDHEARHGAYEAQGAACDRDLGRRLADGAWERRLAEEARGEAAAARRQLGRTAALCEAAEERAWLRRPPPIRCAHAGHETAASRPRIAPGPAPKRRQIDLRS